MKDIITRKEAADYIGLPNRSLDWLNKSGQGPRFIQVSERKRIYRNNDLDAWLESRAVQSV
jgi:hypothetical protein